ncbi:hypothetical protein RUND412_008938 [Rhizina undulata]
MYIYIKPIRSTSIYSGYADKSANLAMTFLRRFHPVATCRFLRQNSTQISPNIYTTRLDTILSTPTWSVRALLPSISEKLPEAASMTPKKLQHLLRLSALPPPSTTDEESRLLSSLSRHLYFVKSIQDVNTTGVTPFSGFRDEVDVHELSYEDVVEAETKLDTEGVGPAGRMEWDAMRGAKRKLGGFFIVDEAVIEEGEKVEIEAGNERI